MVGELKHDLILLRRNLVTMAKGEVTNFNHDGSSIKRIKDNPVIVTTGYKSLSRLNHTLVLKAALVFLMYLYFSYYF